MVDRSKLETALELARAEAEYYKKIAEEGGKKRLREIERLSGLISERDLAEKRHEKLEAEIHQAKKIEAIGMLAGGVAHDLNNILGAIIGYPDLILRKLPQDSPIRKHVLAMRDSGKKAAAIVHDLLTFARIGIGVKTLVDLNRVISDYLISPEHEKLREFHPYVVVKTQFDEAIDPVLGSQVQFSKVIMNLVSNAAEAMPHGGTLCISTQNRQVGELHNLFGSIPKGDYVVVEVSDTGVGISSEDMEKIFEPFFTKKVMGRSGTGLGMSVVWGTVKDHKGYIDIKSEIGKGTTFEIYFPMAGITQDIQHAPISQQDYMGKGESILIVDDVKEQRELSTTMLSSLGYSVNAVSGGEEAVEYLKKRSVDLLVLDMIMDPGMDGLETYQRILEIHPHQRVVIVSGFSETERIKEAVDLGAGTFVKKPFLMEDLAMAVKSELEK